MIRMDCEMTPKLMPRIIPRLAERFGLSKIHCFIFEGPSSKGNQANTEFQIRSPTGTLPSITMRAVISSRLASSVLARKARYAADVIKKASSENIVASIGTWMLLNNHSNTGCCGPKGTPITTIIRIPINIRKLYRQCSVRRRIRVTMCLNKRDCTEHKRKGEDDEVPLSHFLVKVLGKRMRDKLCEDHHNPENKTEN